MTKSLLSYLVLLLEHQVAPVEMHACLHKTKRFFADTLGLLHPQLCLGGVCTWTLSGRASYKGQS